MSYKYDSYFIGIDVDRFMYDLSIGIRLPNPTFCPQQIASMIKKCFHESPNKRPNFKEIKTSLKSDFAELMKVSSSNLLVNTENEHKGTYYALGISKLSSSSDMKFRYTSIQKANQLDQEQKAKVIRYEENKEVVVEINRSESPHKYLEVETYPKDFFREECNLDMYYNNDSIYGLL